MTATPGFDSNAGVVGGLDIVSISRIRDSYLDVQIRLERR